MLVTVYGAAGVPLGGAFGAGACALVPSGNAMSRVDSAAAFKAVRFIEASRSFECVVGVRAWRDGSGYRAAFGALYASRKSIGGAVTAIYSNGSFPVF